MRTTTEHVEAPQTRPGSPPKNGLRRTFTSRTGRRAGALLACAGCVASGAWLDAYLHTATLRAVNLAPFPVVIAGRWTSREGVIETTSDTVAPGGELVLSARFARGTEPYFELESTAGDDLVRWLYGHDLESAGWQPVESHYTPWRRTFTIALPAPHPLAPEGDAIIPLSDNLDEARREMQLLETVLLRRREWLADRGTIPPYYVAPLADDDPFDRGVVVLEGGPSATPLGSPVRLEPGDVIVSSGTSDSPVYGVEDVDRVIAEGVEGRGINRPVRFRVGRIDIDSNVRDTTVNSPAWFNLDAWPEPPNAGIRSFGNGVLDVIFFGQRARVVCRIRRMRGDPGSLERCRVKTENEGALVAQWRPRARMVGQLIAPVPLVGPAVRIAMRGRRVGRVARAAMVGGAELAAIRTITAPPGTSRIRAAVEGAPIGAGIGTAMALLLR